MRTSYLAASISLIGVFCLQSPAFAAFDTNLKYGVRNSDDVREVQEFLQDNGVYNGPVTGNFYTLTLQAVRKFQAKYKINPVNGVWGTSTRTVADSLLAEVVENTVPSSVTSTPIVEAIVYPPAVDLCSNIEGKQFILPYGMVRNGDTCAVPVVFVAPVPVVVTPVVTPPPPPVVEATLTAERSNPENMANWNLISLKAIGEDFLLKAFEMTPVTESQNLEAIYGSSVFSNETQSQGYYLGGRNCTALRDIYFGNHQTQYPYLCEDGSFGSFAEMTDSARFFEVKSGGTAKIMVSSSELKKFWGHFVGEKTGKIVDVTL